MTLGPSYQLPDLRPFRAIQQRMRLHGGAVVTEGGSLESDDYVADTSGWRINGAGDVEFNDGVFRGSLEAVTITGGTIQTDDANPRVVLTDVNPDRITFYNAAGTARSLRVDPTSGYLITESGIHASALVTDAAGSLSTDNIFSVDGMSDVYIETIDTGGITMSGSFRDITNVGDLDALTLTASSSLAGPSIASTEGALNAYAALYMNGNNIDLEGGVIVSSTGTVVVFDDFQVTGTLTLSSGVVSRGAADSGGAGFKVLRTPN